jgi:DNA-binding NtrC family response regulator
LSINHNILPKIAASNKNVLITGEVGTGKENLARAIHAYSDRKKKPFIVLNYSALPGSFPSSKLFGNKSMVFPGSYKEGSRCLALAQGSTLFLHEISETSKVVQQQLLKIMEEKKDKPKGTINSLNASVRVISSTDRNLPALIQKGNFSRDLYFQINGVTLELPPLRKRKEDIPLLIDHFVTCFNRVQSKSVAGVSQDALAMLLDYDFPGNIPELKNIIERALVLCPGDLVSSAHLPEELRKESNVKLESFGIEMAVQAVEAKTIIAALKRNNYNRTAAARDLGIHKSTFFRKIKNLGIVLPQIDGRFRSAHVHDHTL